MDKVIETTVELSKEIQKMPEVIEYSRLKLLVENNLEIIELKENIASIPLSHTKEKENLTKIYYEHPLVVNYLSAKERVFELLKMIKSIIE